MLNRTFEREAQERPVAAVPSPWGTVPPHVAMLNDRVRTSRFLAGIDRVVRPGDVVVDIGTGTGILAIAAARAGASHVYAIEASGIARVAGAMFRANGLADRITLVEGWSTQVELPRRADVLIAEIVGKDPFEEQLLQTTIDARRRLLVADPRLIPGRIRVFAQPMMTDGGWRERATFTPEALRNWQAWYGMNFEALGPLASDTPAVSHVSPQWACGWKPLGDGVLLADLDLTTLTQTEIDTSAPVVVSAAGDLNAVLLYFELEVSPGNLLSTSPEQVDDSNHWDVPVWTLMTPFTVKPGDTFRVSYRFTAVGDQTTVDIGPLTTGSEGA